MLCKEHSLFSKRDFSISHKFLGNGKYPKCDDSLLIGSLEILYFLEVHI